MGSRTRLATAAVVALLCLCAPAAASAGTPPPGTPFDLTATRTQDIYQDAAGDWYYDQTFENRSGVPLQQCEVTLNFI